jgi:hypothetical protein
MDLISQARLEAARAAAQAEHAQSDTVSGGAELDDIAQIHNLLAHYCSLYDSGELDADADSFVHGMAETEYSQAHGLQEVRNFINSVSQFHEGKPQSAHINTNIYIELDESRTSAVSSSYLIKFQALSDFPLQPIFIGQYNDKLAKVDGKWVFTERRCKPLLCGNLSRFLRE